MKDCRTCGSFPCIQDMETRSHRGYWGSLIHEGGCQSWKGKEEERKTCKTKIREEVTQALKAIDGRGRLAGFKDILEEIRRNRVLVALVELEREGEVRQTPDGKWESMCKE